MVNGPTAMSPWHICSTMGQCGIHKDAALRPRL